MESFKNENGDYDTREGKTKDENGEEDENG